MIRRTLVSLTLSLFLLPLATIPVSAQEWGQEVQVITRIHYGDPIYVFLDSLTAVLERNPEVRVRRAEQDAKTVPFKDLREQLYQDGIDVLSATHAFVRYRFDLRDRMRLVETIKEINFIFRADESESDIRIIHVTSRNPLVSELLTGSGVASLVNMKAVTPFRKLIAFPHVSSKRESAIVELGGRALRDDFVHEQTLFLQFLTEHTLANGGSYILETDKPTVAMVGSSQ